MGLPYLQVRDLSVTFSDTTDEFKAVEDVSFDLERGEILALLGDSGSGKSLTALSIMKLLPKNARSAGRISVNGAEILTNSRRSMEDIRGAKVGMVFQEPMSSLNPVLTVARQMTEGLKRHRSLGGKAATRAAIAALSDVGVKEPDRIMQLFPHQLSGGLRQRVLLAAAIALRPAILLADEPTTALDVTVQAQVLDLLVELKMASNMGILLISHDIGVVAEVADRVAVMKGGRILEVGPVEDVLRTPQHEYTRTLLASYLTPERALALRSASR
ncbi:ABC transporter ATP-binding protein [Rhizobium cauense]|uniref:ABC transporter ATP-binding protein n=1 Tax=Rhizobium cauense TaxID=1166683 RepID=UPI001C6E0FC7|nr:ABC transporter ATP-binding protein [Rhizobium cauense]MBW9116828.1 ABC transporter ATP-binding protein [Rhizobium cauense]